MSDDPANFAYKPPASEVRSGPAGSRGGKPRYSKAFLQRLGRDDQKVRKFIGSFESDRDMHDFVHSLRYHGMGGAADALEPD